MQELKRSLENMMDDSQDSALDFEDLSIKWAEHCLKMYDNELLKRGLDISIALRRYWDEYNVQ